MVIISQLKTSPKTFSALKKKGREREKHISFMEHREEIMKSCSYTHAFVQCTCLWSIEFERAKQRKNNIFFSKIMKQKLILAPSQKQT